MCSGTTHIDLHFPVKSIVEKEVVRHADPVGFHGMALAIVVVPHIPWEIKDYPDNVTSRHLFKKKPSAIDTMCKDNFMQTAFIYHNILKVLSLPYI